MMPFLRASLSGHAPEFQGAVLAAMTATWLAGHHIPGSRDATDDIREQLLLAHMGIIRELIPIEEERLLG